MLFSRGQEIKHCKNWTKETIFVIFLISFFYGVFCAKTDLHSNQIFNFVFDSFFEQDHLLNLFILAVKVKKNMGVRSYFLKKRKFCMQNLTKEWKQPPVVILQQATFYNIFILYLWLRIIRRSNQGV